MVPIISSVRCRLMTESGVHVPKNLTSGIKTGKNCFTHSAPAKIESVDVRMSPSPATRIKPLVFLVEPHPLAVESLRHTLQKKNRVRIVSEEKFLDNGLPTHLDPVFVIDKGTAS